MDLPWSVIQLTEQEGHASMAILHEKANMRIALRQWPAPPASSPTRDPVRTTGTAHVH